MTIEARSGQSIPVFNEIARYAMDVYSSPEYKETVTHFPYDMRETVMQGIETAFKRISELDQVIGKSVSGGVKKAKASQTDDLWSTDFDRWDFESDPYGIELLELQKLQDAWDLMFKDRSATDKEFVNFCILADARTAGEGLVINHYKQLVQPQQ